MRRILFFLLVVVSATASAGGELAAQVLVLPARIDVPRPGLVVIIPTKVDADAVAYTAVDDGLQLLPGNMLKDSSNAVGIALEPGVYRVRAIATKAAMGKTAVLSDWVETTISVGGVPPIPPGPVPPTPPVPIPGSKLFMSIFIEGQKLTPAQAKVVYSETVRKELAAGGHQFRTFDVGSNVARDFTDVIATAGGAPCVVVQIKGKKDVVHAAKLPTSAAELVATIRRLEGK